MRQSPAYLPGLLVHARQVHLGDESHLWRLVGVLRATLDLDGVDTVLMYALHQRQPLLQMLRSRSLSDVLTWGGPSMVPFQFVISRSSPSSRPYEHASWYGQSPHNLYQCHVVSYRHLSLSRPFPTLPATESCAGLWHPSSLRLALVKRFFVNGICDFVVSFVARDGRSRFSFSRMFLTGA